jgi:hypothetical protein
MASTSLVLSTNGLVIDNYDGTGYDKFDIDVGSGSSWTRIASAVGKKVDPVGSPLVTYWDCPETAITETQGVRVTMTGVSDTGSVMWTRTAETGALGSTTLEAARWSFSRYCSLNEDYDNVYSSDTTVSGIVYSLAQTHYASVSAASSAVASAAKRTGKAMHVISATAASVKKKAGKAMGSAAVAVATATRSLVRKITLYVSAHARFVDRP